MMHAAAHAREFDVRYTQTDFTKQIRQESGQRTRLSREDRLADEEVQRVIVCHVKLKLENKKNKKPCKQFRKQNMKQSPGEQLSQAAVPKASPSQDVSSDQDDLAVSDEKLCSDLESEEDCSELSKSYEEVISVDSQKFAKQAVVTENALIEKDPINVIMPSSTPEQGNLTL